MNFDVVIVTYNSSKWINLCLDSLLQSEYDSKSLFITVVDNRSSDDSKQLLSSYSRKNEFGNFQCIFSESNLGFGKANNLGVKNSKEDFVFFLNIDTEIHSSCFTELKKIIQRSSADTGLWECRQFPYEHPKYYNPVTLETSWSSGAACVVRRSAFQEVGMFDEKIFMYAEDVDLSWRLRALGYKLLYVPACIVNHYTYQSAGEVKPNQFYNSTYNNLMLRYKFGDWKDVINGYILYSGLLAVPSPFKGHRKRILKSIIKSFSNGLSFRNKNRQIRNKGFRPNFRIWDYEFVREGAFYENRIPSHHPLVSIIIRTCGRPEVLKEALLSVRHQTYSNIEVVVVEDGPNMSQEMIVNEFSDLNIKYFSTITHVGRCLAGNIALENANGEYFNFLDDDDVMFGDHVEVLVTQLTENSYCGAAYAMAFETPIRVKSKSPYEYEEIFHNVIHKQAFNRLILLHHNYFPIQTVLFSRELYDKFGGFDPNLEVLEDWDLWLRYAFNEDFHYVEKVTSMYRVPMDQTIGVERQLLFDRYLHIVRNKHAANGAMLPVKGVLADIEGFMNKGIVVINHIKRGRFDVIFFKLKNKAKSKIKRVLKL
ncbi:glycosyltransferase family 2 protein [Cohnella sp. GCM10020058]|uniref:glycosyltransferase family 2 protein n=1 Tax=Cohnella sp. GCM10020058 TaxID=3317330 RepID=UPI0036359B0A